MFISLDNSFKNSSESFKLIFSKVKTALNWLSDPGLLGRMQFA
jgi:hypothetical protein